MTLRGIAATLGLSLLLCNAVDAQELPTCPPDATPVIALDYGSRYSDDDAARATLDAERDAVAKAALAPLDQFVTDLADQSEALYVGPVSERQRVAKCILGQLEHWANADALSDLRTETVRLTIGSRLAALSMILWQTLPYAPDEMARATVLAWLQTRVDEQITFWGQAPPGAQKGNLRAWAAFAAAAVAVQTGRQDQRDWAAASVETVLCTARPDGGLPQELSRGKYALHYHLHAVAPLVSATLLLERQGIPASQACDGALHRIVDFATAELVNAAKTKSITGVEQNLFDGTDDLMSHQLAWIEPYLLLRSSETLEALARDLRPFIFSKLGGNQTELWHN